jgi:general secretion pathway protein G
MKHPRSRTGFTLIELVLVVALISILAGAALPVASKAWASAARRTTRERLEVLARAALEFARDTGRPPAEASELVERPERLEGWIGPYVAIDSIAPAGAGSLAPAGGGRVSVLDAWRQPIRIAPEPRFAFVSLGPDGQPGADDLELWVDFTPLRRELTLGALARAQAAIDEWRAAHPGAELARDWSVARGELIEAGLLPEGDELERDAFGGPFVADPRTHGGLTRLVSARLLELARAGH